MALAPDHYIINVSVCTRVVPEREYQHRFRVELPSGRTKLEAIETYHELAGIYPHPEHEVALTHVVIHGSLVKTNVVKGE